MNPELDPSLPFSNDTVCQVGDGPQAQIPVACAAGQLGNLPMPGPNTVYGLGSASIGLSCASSSPCPLPH